VATTPASTGHSSSSCCCLSDDTDKFPFPISKENARSREGRYQIFCSVCHGLTGEGMA